MVNIQRYTVKLVKESGGRYDVNKRITSPETMYEMITKITDLENQTQENFYICTLDIKNKITGICEISKGGLNSATVHPRDVFQRALLLNAAAIVLFHNHPSGDTEPSSNDKKITNRLFDAGNILGIEILDHLIIGDNCYLSFREEQLM